MVSSDVNSSSPSRPHALVIPYLAQGHTSPIMQLSKKLASKGFIITWVYPEVLQERIVQSNTQSGRTLPGESEPDFRMEGIPLPGLETMGLVESIEKISGLVGELFERLSQEQPRVTCIISDILMSSWTQELADKYHIPRIAFLPWSQNFNLYFFNVLQLMSRGQNPLAIAKRYTQGATDTIKDADTSVDFGIPGLPPLRPADIPTFLHYGDEFMYDFLGRQFEHCRKAERVLTNTFYELEGLAFDTMSLEVPTYGVGPLLPSGYIEGGKEKRSGTSFWPEQDDCLQWLDEQPPCSVLYVSFGSLSQFSVEQVQEIAKGLEAVSGQRFLWVMRPGLIADVTVDPLTLLPDKFLERTSKRGFVVSWAPQLLVLSHASVGGFLTHFGWNSIAESIANGVPMIGWPNFADQMYNCRFVVHEWKLGMEFAVREDGFVTKDEVERVVKELMEGEEGKEVRMRALKMMEVARNSVVEGGESYKSINALVEKMRSLL